MPRNLKCSPSKILVTLGLLSIVFLSGCASEAPTWFLPASTNATLITNLAIAVFIIAALVFVVVETMLVISVVRFSRKKIAGEPAQIEGNTRFEIAWTAAPAIVLLIVFILSLQTLQSVAYTPAPDPSGTPSGNALHLRVVGHQWWWEFDYPELNITTADELHVPVNTVVNFDLESADVIHSFWVPQLAGKTDVIPGHINHTWFKADQVGTFHGQCAEFCGEEHALMQFRVVVDTAEQFKTWVAEQQAPPPTMSGDAATGEQLFMTGACVGCHTVNNTKAQGKVGPNLTHLASRTYFAGDVFAVNSTNLTRWLSDPPAMKPGTIMPNLHLPQRNIEAIVAYLLSLK